MFIPLHSTMSISPEAGHLPYAFLRGNSQIAMKTNNYVHNTAATIRLFDAGEKNINCFVQKLHLIDIL